jgi:hypothetical protein
VLTLASVRETVIQGAQGQIVINAQDSSIVSKMEWLIQETSKLETCLKEGYDDKSFSVV